MSAFSCYLFYCFWADHKIFAPLVIFLENRGKKSYNNQSQFRVENDSINCKYKVRGIGEKEYCIPHFYIEAPRYLDKSTVLYGRSGTGKTVSTLDIMFHLKPYFPRVWVFAPTGGGTHDYDGISP